MATIEVKGVSKKYSIFNQLNGYISLRDKIGGFYNLRNMFSNKNKKHDFIALDNISFNVEQGDIFGIVGENGSGKSTLLKIISGVTSPSEGKVVVRGKVTSMLEVGTGFHPELTGRENIYLNGAILGMSKKEIDENFKDIVEFSGVEKFLDTPVKHYSSGMYTRLAFSVAVNMDSDILLIDEVLAVGDIDFQKKCFVKMSEIAASKKRTILFVSHNLHAVQSICNKCILLSGGKIDMNDSARVVVQKYIKRKNSSSFINLKNQGFISSDFDLLSIELENGVNNSFCVYWKSPITLKIRLHSKTNLKHLSFVLGIETLEGNMIYNSWDIDYIKENFIFEEAKNYDVVLTLKHNLSIGVYNVALSILGGDKIYANYNQAILEIIPGGEARYPKRNNGIVNFEAQWSSKEIYI